MMLLTVVAALIIGFVAGALLALDVCTRSTKMPPVKWTQYVVVVIDDYGQEFDRHPLNAVRHTPEEAAWN